MRRISSVLLFSFVGVLSLAGQNLIKPKQIAPDTLNRIIIMTDTITEVDTVFREFQYYSIDSLVRQIVNDSLGIDSLWKKDGTYSLRQSYTPNNNLLFGTNIGNNITTGSNNFLVNSGANITTGSNNYIFGNSLTGNLITTGNDNLIIGNLAANNSGVNLSNITAIGFEAGKDRTSTGNVLAIGYRAGRGGSGGTNVLIGDYTMGLGSATTGFNNVAVGSFAMYQNIVGYNNTALGSFALRNGGSTINLRYTTAIGTEAGFNYDSRESVLIGGRSGYFGNGIGNVAIGYQSGYYANGGYNTYVGNHSGFTTTSNLNTYNTAIGHYSGFASVGNFNVFIGRDAGNGFVGSNKLFIENSSSATPLIHGDFSADWIRVNGYFEVRDKTGTAGNIAAWDGDKLVDSGTSLASIGGDPDQTLSYNSATSDLTISGTGGNTIALPEMVAYPIGSTGYGYRPEISAALAGGEPLLITEGSGINIVDNGVGTGFSISATDASTTNELQTISKSGELVTLSDGGGSFSTHTIDLGTQIAIVQPGGSTSDVVVGDIDITVPGTAATSVIGRDINGVITGVTLGSGLSLSSGTLSSTATSLWDTDGLNVYRSTGRVGVGGVEHPTYTFTANSGTIHTNGAIRGDDFYITGGLFDAGASDGASGDILTSTGTAVDWVTPAINLDPGIGGLLSGSGTFTSSTPTKINFTSSLSDGITASTVNEDLTIPATGYYRITANGIIAVEDDAVFNVYIYVNGSVARSYSLTQTAGNDARVISFNFIQSLTSGWAVDVRVAKTSGTSNVQASSWDLMAEFIKT